MVAPGRLLASCSGESQDKVALVTGAGSPTGIGFACARVLAREGASVAVASTTDRIHERAATLHGDGADAAGFIADLTDRSRPGAWSRRCSSSSAGSTSWSTTPAW